ncbi:hypothetical protein [Pontibacter chitinilyticus]|uniref:hypothetical protein n=1 Tax=Pontibacter chitinilyticus TaxID=2674989 RepID=UPI00321BC38B
MKEFTGNTEAEVWQQVAADMAAQKGVLRYTAMLTQQGRQMLFDLDIDLGGGFESGISTTTFKAAVPAQIPLRFHLYEQDLLHEIGKVLGMEDVKLGYPEFDDAFIVQTNQPETLKKIFANEETRRILRKHSSASLKLDVEDDTPNAAILRFRKDEAIGELTDLQEVYHVMWEILVQLA